MAAATVIPCGQSLRGAAAEAAPRAPAVAVELLGHVERLLRAAHPERDWVLADLVENMLRAGTVAAGAALAEAVLARSPDRAVDRRLRLSLVGALSLLNRPLDLIRQAEAALRDSPDPPLSDQAFFQSMIALARAGRLGVALTLGGASKFAFPIGDDKLHRVTVIQICGVTVRRSEGRGDFWRAEGAR